MTEIGATSEGEGMNLNGILIGSEDPQRLTAYHTSLFGEPGGALISPM
jgi:hypothetical protein